MPHHRNATRRCPVCGELRHPDREFAHCGCCERLRCTECLKHHKDEDGRPVCPGCAAELAEMTATA